MNQPSQPELYKALSLLSISETTSVQQHHKQTKQQVDTFIGMSNKNDKIEIHFPTEFQVRN